MIQKKHLLIVDDAPVMSRFLALFLSQKYEVSTCENAAEALQLLDGGIRPDLIISDLDMPGIGGFSFLRSCRQRYPAMPLIVVSGLKESKHRIEALHAGADDFLSKPFHPAELDVRISKMLEKVQLVAETEKLSARKTFTNFTYNTSAI